MSEDLIWVEFGKIYIKLGAYDDAVSAFLKAIDLNPDSGLAYCNLAYAYQEKGDYGKAVALYHKSIPMIADPKSQAAAWNNLGNTYRILRDLDNANTAYQKADALEMQCAIGVKSPVPQASVGKEGPLPDGKKPEDASPGVSSQEAAKQLIVGRFASYPNSGASENPVQRREQERPPAAGNAAPSPVPAAGDAGKPGQAPGPESRKPQAASDPALEEILAKVKFYEKITKANPMNDRAWDTLGKYYKALGRFSDAIAAYQNAINIVPSREVYYYYLGLLYSVEKQYDNAIRTFLEVVRLNPDYVLAHSALAGLYRRMGMEAKANQHIAIAMPKMANESNYNRACFYATCGDTELAIEFLRLALQNKDTTIEWILSDPDLDQMREDERFRALIEKDAPPPKVADQNLFSATQKPERASMLELLNSSMAR